MDTYLSLLDSLADRDGGWIEPTYDPATRAVTYPGFDAGHGMDDPVGTLESLRTAGLLEREFVDRAVACPDCGSEELGFDQVCPDCGSANTVTVEVIEHTDCGCVKPETAFETADGHVCPECDAAIASVADECERMGTMQECRACGERSDTLTHRLDCPGCGSYDPAELHTVRLHRYRFDADRREWLDGLLRVRSCVTDALVDRGYRVQRNAVLTGATGEDHRIDLEATDPTFGIDLTVLVRDTVDVAAIADLEHVASDTGTVGVLATTATAKPETAAKLAAERDVVVVRVGEDRSVVAADGSFDDVGGVERAVTDAGDRSATAQSR